MALSYSELADSLFIILTSDVQLASLQDMVQNVILMIRVEGGGREVFYSVIR